MLHFVEVVLDQLYFRVYLVNLGCLGQVHILCYDLAPLGFEVLPSLDHLLPRLLPVNELGPRVQSLLVLLLELLDHGRLVVQ